MIDYDNGVLPYILQYLLFSRWYKRAAGYSVSERRQNAFSSIWKHYASVLHGVRGHCEWHSLLIIILMILFTKMPATERGGVGGSSYFRRLCIHSIFKSMYVCMF